MLGSLFNTQSFGRGDSILVQGEPSKGLYLIMSGTVEIRIPLEKGAAAVAIRNLPRKLAWMMGNTKADTSAIRTHTIILERCH